MTVPIVTNDEGVAPCCALVPQSEGGQVEGDPAVVTLNVATKATPLLTAARASGVATLVSVPQGGTVWTHIPLAITPFDYDLGDMYDPQIGSTFTIRKAGYYRVKGFIVWLPPGLPPLGNCAIHYQGIVAPVGDPTQAYAYEFKGGLYQRQGYQSSVTLGFDDTLGFDVGDTIGLYAYFTTDGAAYPASIDVGAGFITLRMIAPEDVLAGPTGICNEMAKTTLSAYEKARCVTNPTTCDCPEDEWPLGLALTMDVVATEAVPAEAPSGLAFEADAVYTAGVLSEAPSGLAFTMDAVYTAGVLSEAPSGLAFTMDVGTSTPSAPDLPSGLAVEMDAVYTPGAGPPVFVDYDDAGGNSLTSLSVSRPAGASNGNLLLGFICLNNTSAVGTPGGWTLIGRQDAPTFAGSLLSYWRVADGSADDTFDPTFSSATAIGVVGAFSGQHATTPINVSGSSNASFTTTHAAATPTTTAANCLVIRAIGIPGSGGISTSAPTGTVDWVNDFKGTLPQCLIEGNYEVQATAGITTARSWTTSMMCSSAMWTIGIAPP